MNRGNANTFSRLRFAALRTIKGSRTTATWTTATRTSAT